MLSTTLSFTTVTGAFFFYANFFHLWSKDFWKLKKSLAASKKCLLSAECCSLFFMLVCTFIRAWQKCLIIFFFALALGGPDSSTTNRYHRYHPSTWQPTTCSACQLNPAIYSKSHLPAIFKHAISSYCPASATSGHSSSNNSCFCCWFRAKYVSHFLHHV